MFDKVVVHLLMFTDKTTEELARMVQEERARLQQFRFVMAGGKSKNVKEGKRLRKEIARIMTALKQRKPIPPQ